MLIWLKYEINAQTLQVEFGGKYGYSRANTDIWGNIIRIFALSANNQHWLLAIIGHARTNILERKLYLFKKLEIILFLCNYLKVTNINTEKRQFFAIKKIRCIYLLCTLFKSNSGLGFLGWFFFVLLNCSAICAIMFYYLTEWDVSEIGLMHNKDYS